MKRHIASAVLILTLGAFSWGQGLKEPFDVKKSGEELEIMKGILNTTLNFFAQNTKQTSSRWRFSNLSAFYLAGQGAVFVIPTSGLRLSESRYFSADFPLGPEFAEEMARLEEEISMHTHEIGLEAARAAREAAELASRSMSKIAAPAPPAPPAPPTPPPAPAVTSKDGKPAKLEAERDKLRKAVEDAQERVRKARENADANREKFLQSLSDVKGNLVEALANYGDSMTTVKADEYINIVLLTSGLDGQRTRSDVISARKSWITDYKAGKLNLEGFRQKVVQYNQ